MSYRFLGIDHLGVAVRDLERACRTYVDTLGMTAGGTETLPERGLAVRFVDTGGPPLELLAPTTASSEISRFLDKRGEGLHHVCLQVSNIEAALADLAARGAQLVDATPRPGAHGSRVAFLHPKSAHGVLIELVEKRREP